MSSASIHQQSRTARRGVVLLLALFVLAQTLGLVHRGLHGDAGNPPSAPAGMHAHAVTSETEQSPGWIDGLFGDHADPSGCLLFDVIAQPGCAPAYALIQPVLLPNAFLAATRAAFVARWSALFDARGPPHSH